MLVVAFAPAPIGPWPKPLPAMAPAAHLGGGEPVEQLLLGASVQGRPIVARQRRGAAPARHIAVIGVIHGDEPAGRAVTDALYAVAVPDNLTLTVIPTVNPDGEAAGTRTNAHGVDLNRNFPHDWRPLGTGPYTSVAENPGPAPLSEPESQALQRWLWAARPDLVIWYHQPWGAVVCDGASGPTCPALAASVDLPVIAAPRPGSAAQWAAANGMHSAVVELAEGPADAATVARHVAAITGLYAAVAPRPPLPVADLSDGLGPPGRLRVLDAPLRLVDTRLSGDPLPAGQRRRVALPGWLAVQGATALSLTLVAVEPTGIGYLAVGTDATGASSSALNFQGDSPATSQHLAVAVHTGPEGVTGFELGANGATTHLIVDVDGVWLGHPASGLGLHPDGPRRVLDSRDEAVALAGSRRVVITGLPPEAEAVELHMTAIGSGWVAAWPGDRDWSGTSSLNVHHGISDGSMTVRLDAADSVWLHSPVSAHVVVDVLAWYGPGGLAYRAMAAPARVFDSRLRSGARHAAPIGWNERWALTLPNVPAGTAAAAFNVTSVGGGDGWSVLWAAGAMPWASVAQHVPGTGAVAAQSPVPVLAGSAVGASAEAFSSAVGRHVVVDVFGLYTA